MENGTKSSINTYYARQKTRENVPLPVCFLKMPLQGHIVDHFFKSATTNVTGADIMFCDGPGYA